MNETTAIDGQRLKSIQRPLKDRYRESPEAAVVTLSASGVLDDQQIACSVSTGKAIVEAGLHPATGGSGSLACSGDMLLEALVACAGVTLRSVAVNRGIPVEGGRVVAEGDLDFRGTLAVDRSAPVGFTSIRLRFELEGKLSDEQLEELQTLTERYCVVFQTLASPPALEVAAAAGSR